VHFATFPAVGWGRQVEKVLSFGWWGVILAVSSQNGPWSKRPHFFMTKTAPGQCLSMPFMHYKTHYTEFSLLVSVKFKFDTFDVVTMQLLEGKSDKCYFQYVA
jgi:hypothetical protein